MAAYQDGLANGRTYCVEGASAERMLTEFEGLKPNLSQGEYGLGFVHGMTERLAKVDLVAAAKFYIDNEMSAEARDVISRLIDNCMAVWRLDPVVEGVVGLCGSSDNERISTNEAYLVVYLNGTTPDFETTMAFEDAREGRI
jgi:hypothetical protein